MSIYDRPAQSIQKAWRVSVEMNIFKSQFIDPDRVDERYVSVFSDVCDDGDWELG